MSAEKTKRIAKRVFSIGIWIFWVFFFAWVLRNWSRHMPFSRFVGLIAFLVLCWLAALWLRMQPRLASGMAYISTVAALFLFCWRYDLPAFRDSVLLVFFMVCPFWPKGVWGLRERRPWWPAWKRTMRRLRGDWRGDDARLSSYFPTDNK